jgi:hypothetical protein
VTKKEILTIKKELLHFIEDSLEEESDVCGFGGTTDERIAEFTMKKLSTVFKSMREYIQIELAEL